MGETLSSSAVSGVSQASASHRPQPLPAWALWSLCLLALLLRLFLGHHYFGFLAGDDVEILETGFRRALGLAYQPWVIRNTLVPDLLVAPAVRAAAGAGITEARTLAWIATWPFVALSVGSVILLERLARRWGYDGTTASLAALLFTFHWLPMGYGSTVYPRTFATFCLLAAALLASARRSALAGLAAGALVAVAAADRYSEVIFLPAVAWTAWRTSPGKDDGGGGLGRAAWVLVGFGLGGALAFGVADWITRGKPFSSLLEFARYTLVEQGSSSLERAQPWHFYVGRHLPHWLSLALWPPFFVALRRRQSSPAWLYAALPLAVLSLIHHKELRYLQGVIPFVSLLAAVGLVELARSGWRRSAVLLTVVTLGWGIYSLGFLERKSMPAVLAAEALAGEPKVRTFAAPQLWAFGHRLILGNEVAVRELPYPVTPADLRRLVPGADAVALYAAAAEATPALEATLSELGFCRGETYSWSRRSKAVRLYRLCPAP